MTEDDERGRAVVVVLEELGSSEVGEMADSREHTLLDAPWVWAVLEHLEIMIGFEKKNINALERSLHVGRHVAEVCCECHSHAFSGEDEAARIGGVVRNGEGRDVEIANGELATGVEVLDGGKERRVGLRAPG